MTKALMFMGTGSDVGKSTIVAGLLRAYSNRGLRVAPFKPQNMSNNAAVTADGGEIGRAQALQARAARQEPLTTMNPVLLKPEADSGAQLILRGRRIGTYAARDYWQKRGALLPEVLFAFRQVAAMADLVLVEGAGSASEVNLRNGDIANWGFARAANIPVVLVGDIDRGGVIASLVGTFAVIDQLDAMLVRATLVNKFRGDPELFGDGLETISGLTEVPALGPIPFFPDARRLPAEDTLALDRTEKKTGRLTIAVPRLPRIANFDDLDPLRAEPDVNVVVVEPGDPIPQRADLILIPGSKATRNDLAAMKRAGWDIDILAHHRAGKPVLGICGGYQMLGKTVSDPKGVEGEPGLSRGLGLLDVDTTLTEQKDLRIETATHLLSGEPITGYHMHMGETVGRDRSRSFAQVAGEREGAISADGRVMGTYLHGLFSADGFRRAFLGTVADPSLRHDETIDQVLDDLAAHLEQHLDLDRLLGMAETV